MIDDWPLSLQPSEIKVSLARASRMGPQPLAGPPMAVLSPTMHWRITHGRVWVTPALALLYEAIAGTIAGMAAPIMISPWRFRFSPRNIASPSAALAIVPFSDGALFSDGAGWRTTPIDFVVGVNAGANVTAIIATQSTPGLGLQAGQYIGLGSGDARALYRIIGAAPRDGDSATFDLILRPPLRAAVTAGDAIETEDPRCPCVCVTPDLDVSLINGLYGYVDLEFQEIPR